MSMFVWVKDPSTGHEFDVPEDDWRLKAEIFIRVKDDRHPPVGRPRRAKHHFPIKKTDAVKSLKKEPTDG